jgi:hypothetical protein
MPENLQRPLPASWEQQRAARRSRTGAGEAGLRGSAAKKPA